MQLLARLGVDGAQRLVEQQHAGRAASARASATRWRSPPDSVAGRRPSSSVVPTPSASRPTSAIAARASAGASPRRPARRAHPVGDVRRHREVREEQAVLEDEADAASLRRSAGDVGAVDRTAPRPAGRTPAIASSTRVLPAPLGPSSTT